MELKFAPNRRWDDGIEAVPADVQDQVQTQMLVSGYPMARIAVLMGGRVDWHEIPADPKYQAALLTTAIAFRQQVLTGQRPAIDGSESTRKALARLHPARDAGPAGANPRAGRAGAGPARREGRREGRRRGGVPPGERPARRAGRPRGRGRRHVSADVDAEQADHQADWKAVAADYRRVLAEARGPMGLPYLPAGLDEIERGHTTTSEGARVLRTRFLDEETNRWL